MTQPKYQIGDKLRDNPDIISYDYMLDVIDMEVIFISPVPEIGRGWIYFLQKTFNDNGIVYEMLSENYIDIYCERLV